jgi:hypothetical protein
VCVFAVLYAESCTFNGQTRTTFEAAAEGPATVTSDFNRNEFLLIAASRTPLPCVYLSMSYSFLERVRVEDFFEPEIDVPKIISV